MKLLTVRGARPQFVEAAAVSLTIAACDGLREVMVRTWQHFDANMSDIFFEQLAIRWRDCHLAIGGGMHGAMTGRQREVIERVLMGENPDRVLVYGDIISTLDTALAVVKLHIPVAHVEAGLRSFPRRIPEEINRILSHHASDLLFAPTDTARRSLAKDGIPAERMYVVSVVIYGACLFYRARARWPAGFEQMGVEPGTSVLATVHRVENVDDLARLTAILQGLAGAGRQVIHTVHPRTRQRIVALGLPGHTDLSLLPPVGHLEVVWLELNGAQVATDSGGVQKEAYSQGKHCETLRDETRWVELAEVWVNVLVGADARCLSNDLANRGSFLGKADPYRDGQSAVADVARLPSSQGRVQ